MSVAIRLLLFFSLVFYGFAYNWLDGNMQDRPSTLQAAPPLKLLQAVSGYFRQLNAEMMFVQTSVFLGGLKTGTNESEYEVSLAHNLRIMTSLYPEFKDPYFYTNSFLAPISQYSAEQASLIFETGIKSDPSNLILRFFNGANFFYNLQQPNNAAEAFAQTAKLENAPPIFSHLAAVFSAQGGNLQGGLIILKTMLKTTKDDIVKERYMEEISYFESAISIQNAVNLYIQSNGIPPKELNQLVPQYLNKIPKFEKRFILLYKPPTITLKRP